MDRHICFITPSHLSSCPRLVKEAAAASKAGYRVTVIYSHHIDELRESDDTILRKHPTWEARKVEWGRGSRRERVVRVWSAVRQRVARQVYRRGGGQLAAVHAQGRLHNEILGIARDVIADLYVAHNLAALPVAVRAAAFHRAKLGFDAEDFHRGELPDSPEHQEETSLQREIEARYMPQCDYVTAASEGIARAYAEVLGIEPPTTILNVFPLAERDEPVPTALMESEKSVDTLSLYWFSQTIGPGRGLEDALEALLYLEDHVVLSLRGTWSAGYERTFMGRAETLGVAHRVRVLPRVPPAQIIPLTTRHDVGLALEPGTNLNNGLAVSNKLFTYLLAGVPTVATDTPGQRDVGEAVPGPISLVPIGDPKALAQAANYFLQAGEVARQHAAEVATNGFNWELESGRLLNLWQNLWTELST